VQPVNEPMPVSVIIPTLGRKSLESAITSVLNQSYPATEIILVDDSRGLTVKEYSGGVKILRNTDQFGQVYSRNKGICAAKNPIIALLDDDDTWDTEKLCESIRNIDMQEKYWLSFTLHSHSRVKFKEDLFSNNANAISNNQEILDYILKREKIYNGLGQLQSSTLTFSKQLAVDFPMIDFPFHTDLLWLMQLIKNCPKLKIYPVNKKLVNYNRVSKSVSKNISAKDSFEFVEKFSYLLTQKQTQNYLVNFTARYAVETKQEIREIIRIVKTRNALNSTNYKTKIWFILFFVRTFIRRPRH
jgi:glycosyltransferase involved in cell wall biosynthesis